MAKHRKTLDERINTYRTRKPARIIYSVLVPTFANKRAKHNNAVFIDNADLANRKEPILFLINHQSRADFIYFCKAVYPHCAHIVVNRYFYHNNVMRPFLRRAGCIPKKQFMPDAYAMREILRVARRGEDIAIWPEGMNSYHGATMPILAGIEKLIKKIDMPVVLVKINGAFLTSGRLRTDKAKGKIVVETSNLLSLAEVEQFSSEQILEVIEEQLSYNDYKWAKDNNVEFDCEDYSQGMDKVLYLCPHCKSQFTLQAGNNKIVCTSCSKGVAVNKFMNFEGFDGEPPVFVDLPAWFKYQVQEARKVVELGDYSLHNDVTLQMYDRSIKEKTVGTGHIVLDSNGLTYTPTTGKQITFTLNIKDREQLCYFTSRGGGFEFYIGDQYYCIRIGSSQLALKYIIYWHEAHKILTSLREAEFNEKTNAK